MQPKDKPGTIRGILILGLALLMVYHQVSTSQRVDDLEQAVIELNTEIMVDRIERHSQQPEPQRRFTPNKQPADFTVIRTDHRLIHQPIDVFCLAKNIFHEAGVEDDLGKYAVAQVTVNRVKNPRYPNTICEVVMQRRQFSWANDRTQRWTQPQGPLWQRSREIAELVLLQGHRLRGLEAANYYHADYVDPVWASRDYKITQLGTHVFYAAAAQR